MDTVRRAMEGGDTIFEEPVLDRHGMVQCHLGTGEPLMRRRFSPPNGRLALEYLARMDPARYGRQAAPWGGHTAAGPESVEQSEVVAGLAKRLAEVRAKQQEDRDRVLADGAVDGGAMPSGAATGGSQPHWASSTPTLVPGTPSSG